jgi:hypothetical protein
LLADANVGVADPGAFVDDRGLDFETRVVARSGNGYRWASLFHPSRAEWAALATLPLRVRAAAPDAAPVATPPFSGAAMPSACTAGEVRECQTQ